MQNSYILYLICVMVQFATIDLGLSQTTHNSSDSDELHTRTILKYEPIVEAKERRSFESSCKILPSVSDVVNNSELWTWTGNGTEHGEELNLVYWDSTDKVAVYLDSKIGEASAWKKGQEGQSPPSYNGSATWLFCFTSRVWRYMRDTYGEFGPDPFLYLVIRERSKKVYWEYSLRGYSSRNILDIGDKNRKNPWTAENGIKKRKYTDTILQELSFNVEYSSHGRLGSPSEYIWKFKTGNTAWTDIFVFDVYTSLKMPAHAYFYSSHLISSAANPSPFARWFQNWFLPIYQSPQNGGPKVLNKYFSLLSQNLPFSGVNYNYTLNHGEFVLFWSGAAKQDLRQLNASKVFNWNEAYHAQFLEARETFPSVTDLYVIVPDAKFPVVTKKPRKTTTAKPELKISVFTSTTTKKPGDIAAQGVAKVISGRDTQPTIIGGSLGGAYFLILTTVVIAFVKLYQKKVHELKSEIRELTKEEVEEFFEGDPKLNPDEDEAMVLAMPFIKHFEVPLEHMVPDRDDVLGEGQFGIVMRGFLCLGEDQKQLLVAIKTVKKNVDVLYFKAFLSEVKIMAYLGNHENIVQLLGTCTTNIQNREILIALEYCPLGNLEDYLTENGDYFQIMGSANTDDEGSCSGSECTLELSAQGYSTFKKAPNVIKITTLDLLKWSEEISNAMVYLTQKKVIHGDVAARNVLLTSTRMAKIGDFGLSRQFLNYENYVKTSKLPVPWRSLSIEAFKKKKFSTASDVWAFGVTLWEIFSFGDTPYGAWTYDLSFVGRLVKGDRLLKPEHANQEVYDLMTDCWKMEPADRPKFQEIHTRLEGLIKTYLEPKNNNENK